MNENSKWLPSIIVVGIFALAFSFVGFMIARDYYKAGMGSVGVTNEYQATSTIGITGTTYKAAQTRHLVQAATYGSVTLGSVVVASTTQNAMSIYNATSSEAVIDGTYGTLITTLPASTPQGTYTYDIEMNAGLVLDLAEGFGGDYTITYRR